MDQVTTFQPIRSYATGDEDGLYVVVEFIPVGSDDESYVMDFEADTESKEPRFEIMDSKEASLTLRRVKDHLVADLVLHSPDGEDETHTLPFAILDGRRWPDEWIL